MDKEVRTFMRTNGFICIALGVATISMANQPGYLPSVGPLPLRVERSAPARAVAALPPLHPPEPHADTEFAPLPITAPEAPGAETNRMGPNPPIVLPETMFGAPTNAVGPLIGPLMDNSGAITPQMFMRFFTPPQGGVSRETIIVPPPGFNPAQPPPPSSTATYSQPKP